MNLTYPEHINLYATQGGAYKTLTLNFCSNINFHEQSYGTQVVGKLPDGKFVRITQIYNCEMKTVAHNIDHVHVSTANPELAETFLAKHLSIKLHKDHEAVNVFAGGGGCGVLIKTLNNSLLVPEHVLIEILTVDPEEVPLDQHIPE